MNKLIKLFALLMLFSLQCCKEIDSVNYPITYLNLPVTDFTIRAFTINGEITDTTKFNYLIKKYGNLLTGMNNYKTEGDFNVTYLNSENVKIHKSISDDTDTLTIHIKNDLIYWERKDTLSTFLKYNSAYKYKPLYYEELAIPISSGFPLNVKYKQCYYVKPEGEYLILPMFDILYYVHDINLPIPSIDINNEFCIDSISAFGDNDTIIIKGYTLKLKKLTIKD